MKVIQSLFGQSNFDMPAAIDGHCNGNNKGTVENCEKISIDPLRIREKGAGSEKTLSSLVKSLGDDVSRRSWKQEIFLINSWRTLSRDHNFTKFKMQE